MEKERKELITYIFDKGDYEDKKDFVYQLIFDRIEQSYTNPKIYNTYESRSEDNS